MGDTDIPNTFQRYTPWDVARLGNLASGGGNFAFWDVARFGYLASGGGNFALCRNAPL